MSGRVRPLLVLALLPGGLAAAVGPAADRPDGPGFGLERHAHRRVRLHPPPAGLLALTFDDGPSADTTPAILDELRRRGVRATFFVNAYRLGGRTERALRQREILRAEAEQGHAVGNHTFDHQRLSDLDPAAQEREIIDGEAGISRVLGERPYLFRPPYGRMAEPAARVLAKRGYTVVQWNISSEDPFLRSPEQVLDHVLAEVRREGGGVVLFHDTHPWTALALPRFFDALAGENCRRLSGGEPALLVVPLDRLLAPRYSVRPARAPEDRVAAAAREAEEAESDRLERRRIADGCNARSEGDRGSSAGAGRPSSAAPDSEPGKAGPVPLVKKQESNVE